MDEQAKSATIAAPRSPLNEIPALLQGQEKIIEELLMNIELLTGKIAPILDRTEKDSDPGKDSVSTESDIGGQLVTHNARINRASRIIYELQSRVML